ncbi:Transcriptional regulator OS=Streptomyces fumanus OX=67302 GN=GCM10018772_33390 PE=3 SV=1 [Streptomyces fumanus]
MERQQRFLGALVNKVRGNDVLLNPVKLYPVLNAATSSLTTDPGLASLRDLYALVRGLRDIPTERVQFLTVPREAWAGNPNRDQLKEPDARELFARLRTTSRWRSAGVHHGGPMRKADRKAPPVSHRPTTGRTATATLRRMKGDPSSTRTMRPPEPTFRGNTAAEKSCE